MQRNNVIVRRNNFVPVEAFDSIRKALGEKCSFEELKLNESKKEIEQFTIYMDFLDDPQKEDKRKTRKWIRDRIRSTGYDCFRIYLHEVNFRPYPTAGHFWVSFITHLD